jgi:hypothetical protein
LADVKHVQTIAAVTAAGWDSATLRTELNNQDIGPILEEVKTRQHQDQKDITY